MSEALKREAAARAVAEITSGMKLGLGTGSTARHFVDLLGERVAQRWVAWLEPKRFTQRASNHLGRCTEFASVVGYANMCGCALGSQFGHVLVRCTRSDSERQRVRICCLLEP